MIILVILDLENDPLAYNLNSETQISIEFNLIFNSETHVPSVESIWKTADWHEREAFDMMGIKFFYESFLDEMQITEMYIPKT